MGQQQLLLLVLGIVIVGLAVVVGINAFGENQKRANADAMVNDALRIASDLQAYALKPAQFGGSGGWDKIGEGTRPDIGDDLLKEGLGYSFNGEESYTNVNGEFSLTGAPGTGIIIEGINSDQSNNVRVRVCGVTSREIFTRIDYEGAGLDPQACAGGGSGS